MCDNAGLRCTRRAQQPVPSPLSQTQPRQHRRHWTRLAAAGGEIIKKKNKTRKKKLHSSHRATELLLLLLAAAAAAAATAAAAAAAPLFCYPAAAAAAAAVGMFQLFINIIITVLFLSQEKTNKRLSNGTEHSSMGTATDRQTNKPTGSVAPAATTRPNLQQHPSALSTLTCDGRAGGGGLQSRFE